MFDYDMLQRKQKSAAEDFLETVNTLKEIRKEGTTILIVEQNALATLKIADYAYVLELGSISLEGPASELINDKSLIEAYLGGKK